MKKIFIPTIFMLLLTTLLSCNKRDFLQKEVELKVPVESDVFIRNMKIIPVSSLRRGGVKKEVISFKDEISDEEYSCSITENSDGDISLMFDNNGTLDSMTLHVVSELDNNYVISGKYQNRNLITGVRIKNLEKGGISFELNNDLNNNLRVIYYESWWDCVKRITFDGDVAMGTMIASFFTGGRASAVVAAAAGVICLRQSSRKIDHIDNSPGEIKQI